MGEETSEDISDVVLDVAVFKAKQPLTTAIEKLAGMTC